MEETRNLAKHELGLAKRELRAQVKTEVKAATGLGVAGLCSLLTLNLLLVAVAFLLSIWLPGWLSALLVAAFTLVVGTIAGLVGWAKRVRTPLPRTQASLKEDLQWAHERLLQAGDRRTSE